MAQKKYIFSKKRRVRLAFGSRCSILQGKLEFEQYFVFSKVDETLAKKFVNPGRTPHKPTWSFKKENALSMPDDMDEAKKI